MATNIKTYPNLIDGTWKTSSITRLEDRNLADHNEIIGLFPMATLDVVRSAIQAARSAFAVWSGTPTPARRAILDKASQILTSRLDDIAMALEGKTLTEAKGEVTRARDIFKYYTWEGWRYSGQVLPGSVHDELLYTRCEPLGVVNIITTWNFPIAIPARKFAPALIYGNMVVFKPAEDATHTALLLVEALVEAGLPPGIINFLTGDGALIGTEMTSNPNVNDVSFTGSHNTGTKVYQNAIKNMARLQLEMGGKNALVILKGANLELAVKLAITGGFDHVELSMRIAQDEIFGPVVGIIRVKDLNDAIEKANAIAISFGLSAGVVKINEPTTGLALNAPSACSKDQVPTHSRNRDKLQWIFTATPR